MVRVRADFSEAAEQGEFSPRHVEEGEYLGVIRGAELGESKNGNAQIVFKIESPQIRGASYPLFCQLDGKASWKLRSLIEACGIKVAGKKAIAFDTDRLIGKKLGIELLDDEYQGRVKSKIQSVFPVSELGAKTEEDAADDEDDYEEEEEAPKTRARKKPAPEPEPEEDEEDEEEEEEKPAPKKRASRRRTQTPPAEDDDDLDLDEL